MTLTFGLSGNLSSHIYIYIRPVQMQAYMNRHRPTASSTDNATIPTCFSQILDPLKHYRDISQYFFFV